MGSTPLVGRWVSGRSRRLEGRSRLGEIGALVGSGGRVLDQQSARAADMTIAPGRAKGSLSSNREAGRGLFFVEMDMATERIVSYITRDSRITLSYKLAQYDRYLQSLRYRQTYGDLGDFTYFTLLFVTIGEERVDNVRRQVSNLPAELAQYYRFTTYDRAIGDFLGPIWKSRSVSDMSVYPLVREPAARSA